MKTFREAVRLSPADPSCWQGLGRVLTEKADYGDRDFDEALRAIEKAVQLDPADPVTRSLCAHIHMELDQFDAAKRRFNEAYELDPQSVAVAYRREVFDEVVPFGI